MKRIAVFLTITFLVFSQALAEEKTITKDNIAHFENTNYTANVIGMATGIAGAITGSVAMFIGLRSVRISRFDIAKEYFKADDSPEMRKNRKSIYTFCGKDNDLLANESFAAVCSHYHFYGLMCKKHYIPRYAFDSVNGEAIIKCYELSKKYIELRRRTYPSYAEYFEWLYIELKKSSTHSKQCKIKHNGKRGSA